MKKSVDPMCNVDKTVNAMSSPGLLLVSTGKDGRANVMTVGWGLIGRLWDKPFFAVAIRRSRYTFNFIEESGEFTINVPREDMAQTVAYCGSVSGREHDKFKEKNLTLIPGRKVRSPTINECWLSYECKVAFKAQVTSKMPQSIVSAFYPNNDYHMIYFGEIVETLAEEHHDRSKLSSKSLESIIRLIHSVLSFPWFAADAERNESDACSESAPDSLREFERLSREPASSP